METYIAFIRGINVGGKNVLSMARLKATCEKAGFLNARTYIQSGNVIFESDLDGVTAVDILVKALLASEKKQFTVVVRTPKELEAIISNNPFKENQPERVLALLFQAEVQKNIAWKNVGQEKIKLAEREIYVYYPNGVGKSKLRFPGIDECGTARNINTLNKIAALAAE